MPEPKTVTIRCRCCDEPFESKREHAQTCSVTCRQRLSRMLRAGWRCEWGTFARYVNKRRPPGMGVRRLAKLRRDELRSKP